MFFKLFNYFVDLCLLRKAPQDLPASTQLFAILLLLSVLVGAAGVSDMIPGVAAIAASMLDAVILLVLLKLALLVKKLDMRFLQAATAILGAGIILGLLAIPMQLAVGREVMESNMGAVIALVYLVLLVWMQVVIGHVMRHALNVSMPLGIGLALTYSVISGTVIQSLFIPVAN